MKEQTHFIRSGTEILDEDRAVDTHIQTDNRVSMKDKMRQIRTIINHSGRKREFGPPSFPRFLHNVPPEELA